MFLLLPRGRIEKVTSDPHVGIQEAILSCQCPKLAITVLDSSPLLVSLFTVPLGQAFFALPLLISPEIWALVLFFPLIKLELPQLSCCLPFPSYLHSV